MLQFGLHTGYLGFHVNHITQGTAYSVVPTMKEQHRRPCSPLLMEEGYTFHDNRVEYHNRILTDNLQLKCLFLGDVLLQTDGTDIADNLFHHFNSRMISSSTNADIDNGLTIKLSPSVRSQDAATTPL